jgi:transposase
VHAPGIHFKTCRSRYHHAMNRQEKREGEAVAWRGLSKAQWEAFSIHVPAPKASVRGRRPRVEDRRCVEGIIWVLGIASPWSELPPRDGSPCTGWRQSKLWAQTRVLLKRWRPFLAPFKDQQQLRWAECVADGSFLPAQQGGPTWARRNAAGGPSGWCWSMARGLH